MRTRVDELIDTINNTKDEDEREDATHELKELIWGEVHLLVDTLTSGLNERMDFKIRQQLTEQFRFWR